MALAALTGGGGPAAAQSRGGASAGSPADAIALASSALAANRPWQATRAIAPVLSDPARRTPEAIIIGARAAAGWDGWAEVQRLLSGAPWLDTQFGGDGRELLARAALERRQDADALQQARLALKSASNDSIRGVRLVLQGRAYDRLDQFDSAAQAYTQAAVLLPALADWLRLRAAGVTADGAVRADLYSRVTIPAAVARIRWTEALALDRTGDRVAAAKAYEALGAQLAAMRVRLSIARDTATRRALRKELFAMMGPGMSKADARSAIALADAQFAPLTAQEQVTIARRAAAAGMLERAATGFAAARGAMTQHDRYTYGTVLARLGRQREALTQFELVTDPSVRGQARYQTARTLMAMGQRAEGYAIITRIPREFPTDTSVASQSLWLMGDVAVDNRDDSLARTRFLQLADRYPTTSYAPRARLQAALIAMLQGQLDSATAELTLLSARWDQDEAWAATYWLGRVRSDAGDSAGAAAAWQQLVDRQPYSYYGQRAARRLGVTPRPPFSGGPIPAATDDLIAALTRAQQLDDLGLTVEARFELDQAADGARSGTALASLAAALLDRNQSARVTALATRAMDRGAPATAELYRLLYPLPFRQAILAEAAADSLSPWLLAGLIRQESLFDPRATSVADARGLMQVMPATGGRLAAAQGISYWDPVMLYQADVSLDFGTQHLVEVIKQYGDPGRALAAYNAGGNRVEQWNQRIGVADDPELFIERIPFVETRLYVRTVLRNQWMYELLYGTT